MAEPPENGRRDAAMTAAFVLHDLGAAEAGEPWRAVVPDGWLAPDLPGHGATPAPRHGAYDPMGPVTLARWALAGAGVVIGVRQNAHGALVLAAGGGCERVAIVDGLWGPWPTPDGQIGEMYAGLRRVFEDEGAISRPPPRGLDPRARHGYGVHVSPEFCRRFWGSVTVPVLAIETPSSVTPPPDRAERVSWFGGAATLIELSSDDPAAVVGACLAWVVG